MTCKSWSPTAAGLRGCSLPNKHKGDHYYTTPLVIGAPTGFSGFGIGKMRLTNPKGVRPVREVADWNTVCDACDDPRLHNATGCKGKLTVREGKETR